MNSLLTLIDELKFLFPFLFALLGIACIWWGYKHLRKPQIKHTKPDYIYSTPVKKMTLWQNLKTSWYIGWAAGRSHAEKKRAERQNK